MGTKFITQVWLICVHSASGREHKIATQMKYLGINHEDARMHFIFYNYASSSAQFLTM